MSGFFRLGVVLSLCFAIASFSASCADTLVSLAHLDDTAKVDELLSAIKNTHAKVILLNMWGIDCAPCIAELPVLSAVAEKLKGNPNVAFIGLCIPDESQSKIEMLKSAASMIARKKVAYRNILWMGG